MDFIKLIKGLERALKEPLPGREGQVLMAPKPIEEERFDLYNMENARKGAVLFLIYPGESGVKVPFIKRQVYHGVHSGQVALPGGKMDPGDIDLKFTAIRETEEEIGIGRKEIEILGTLSDLYISPSNFSVRPFVGFINKSPLFKPDPREVERVIVCDFEHLIDETIKKEKVLETSHGIKIDAPYFEIENEMVWGATAMILSEFLSVWKNIKQ